MFFISAANVMLNFFLSICCFRKNDEMKMENKILNLLNSFIHKGFER